MALLRSHYLFVLDNGVIPDLGPADNPLLIYTNPVPGEPFVDNGALTCQGTEYSLGGPDVGMVISQAASGCFFKNNSLAIRARIKIDAVPLVPRYLFGFGLKYEGYPLLSQGILFYLGSSGRVWLGLAAARYLSVFPLAIPSDIALNDGHYHTYFAAYTCGYGGWDIQIRFWVDDVEVSSSPYTAPWNAQMTIDDAFLAAGGGALSNLGQTTVFPESYTFTDGGAGSMAGTITEAALWCGATDVPLPFPSLDSILAALEAPDVFAASG